MLFTSRTLLCRSAPLYHVPNCVRSRSQRNAYNRGKLHSFVSRFECAEQNPANLLSKQILIISISKDSVEGEVKYDYYYDISVNLNIIFRR